MFWTGRSHGSAWLLGRLVTSRPVWSLCALSEVHIELLSHFELIGQRGVCDEQNQRRRWGPPGVGIILALAFLAERLFAAHRYHVQLEHVGACHLSAAHFHFCSHHHSFAYSLLRPNQSVEPTSGIPWGHIRESVRPAVAHFDVMVNSAFASCLQERGSPHHYQRFAARFFRLLPSVITRRYCPARLDV